MNTGCAMCDGVATKAGQDQLAAAVVQFAVGCGVLRFGEFKTKAGRLSPSFFNAGLFDDGAKLARLAEFYAQRLIESNIEFDVIFGPAYKGIPLGAVLAVELARRGRNVGFAYNRKEAKDHGEGGSLVGAALKGRVLLVADVMSAGTAVRDSIAILEPLCPPPPSCGVLLAPRGLGPPAGRACPPARGGDRRPGPGEGVVGVPGAAGGPDGTGPGDPRPRG